VLFLVNHYRPESVPIFPPFAASATADRFGESAGFFAMGGIAAVGAITLWLCLPGSQPREYTD
jgi:hypothetical protein